MGSAAKNPSAHKDLQGLIDSQIWFTPKQHCEQQPSRGTLAKSLQAHLSLERFFQLRQFLKASEGLCLSVQELGLNNKLMFANRKAVGGGLLMQTMLS